MAAEKEIHMQKRVLTPLIAIAAFLAAGPAVLASDATAPANTSQWTLNLQKSDYEKMPALKPKSALLTVTEQGNKISWTYTGEAQDGKPIKMSFDGAYDGRPYPVKGDEKPATMAYKRAADGQITTTWTDGEHTSTSTASVSPDEKVLTVNNTTKDDFGHPITWVEVYDKK
jgi:hypothetical protein